MPKRDIIVIGGSAGSPAALRELVAAMPSDLEAAVFVVTHVPVHGSMLLARMLGACTDLPVAYAQEGDLIAPGRILIGPPDRHLLLTSSGVRLGLGPRENLSRPAIDALFRSAAVAFGGRVIGVVLTGMLNDGASGLLAVKQSGGAAVVQDPLEAAAPGMPRAALAVAEPDHVVTLAEMGPLLASLSREEAPLGRAASAKIKLEVEVAVGAPLGIDSLAQLAEPSAFSCPQCQGVLSEIKGDGPRRYRCQIGHALTAEILDERQERALDRAMGVALRIMEERIALVKRLAADASMQGNHAAAALHDARTQDYEEQAEILRQAVISTMTGQEPETDLSHDGPKRVA